MPLGNRSLPMNSTVGLHGDRAAAVCQQLRERLTVPFQCWYLGRFTNRRKAKFTTVHKLKVPRPVAVKGRQFRHVGELRGGNVVDPTAQLPRRGNPGGRHGLKKHHEP